MAVTSGGHVRRDVAAITELIIRLLAYTAPPPPGTYMHMMRSSLSWICSQSTLGRLTELALL